MTAALATARDLARLSEAGHANGIEKLHDFFLARVWIQDEIHHLRGGGTIGRKGLSYVKRLHVVCPLAFAACAHQVRIAVAAGCREVTADAAAVEAIAIASTTNRRNRRYARQPDVYLATPDRLHADTTIQIIAEESDMQSSRRQRAMVLLMGLDTAQAEVESEHWRGVGAMVVRAHNAGGCLRMATCIGPDVIVLDRRVPERLVRLLKAHPVSSSARIDWVPSLLPSGV